MVGPPVNGDPSPIPKRPIKTPLFRSDRRGQRNRVLLIVVGVSIAGGAGVAALGWGPEIWARQVEEVPVAEDVPDYSRPGDPEPVPEVPAEPEQLVEVIQEEAAPTEEGATVRKEVRFDRARNFRQAVKNGGASPEEAGALETALTGVLDFRKLRPTDRLIYERDAAGALVMFEYRQSAVKRFQARRASEGRFTASQVEVNLETRRIALGGRVERSIGGAFESAGLPRSLANRFVSAFEGKVKFSEIARAGDEFRIAVDQELLDGSHYRYASLVAVEYRSQAVGTKRVIWFDPPWGDPEWFDASGRSMAGGWLRMPLVYQRLSSPFDPLRMHPILKRVHPHNGTDFAAATGTPLWAGADGVITWAGPKGPNGNLVSIRHAGGFESFYAHMHRIERGIRPGVQVTQRQLIGSVGTTGRSTGPHLHFGLKKNGQWIDAMTEINGPGRMLPPRPRRQFLVLERQLRRLMNEVEVAAEEG